MSKKNQDWINIEDDHSDQEPQIPTKIQDNKKQTQPEKSELQRKQENISNVPHKSKNVEEGKKFNMEEFRAQQLIKLDQIKNNQVWVFIFKNPRKDIAITVKNIPCIKISENEKGYDLKIKKEQAYKLLTEKNYLRLQLSRKNDPRTDRNDGKPRQYREPRQHRITDNKQKKKYVEKVIQQQQKVEQIEKDKYAYKKVKKIQDRQKDENYQNTRTKKEYKESKDFGLGNFRNKPKIENQEKKIQVNKQINTIVETKANLIDKSQPINKQEEKKQINQTHNILKQEIKQVIKQVQIEQKKLTPVVKQTIKQQHPKNQNEKIQNVEKKHTYQSKKYYEERKKPYKNINSTSRKERQQERERQLKKKEEEAIKKTNPNKSKVVGYNPFSNLGFDDQD